MRLILTLGSALVAAPAAAQELGAPAALEVAPAALEHVSVTAAGSVDTPAVPRFDPSLCGPFYNLRWPTVTGPPTDPVVKYQYQIADSTLWATLTNRTSAPWLEAEVAHVDIPDSGVGGENFGTYRLLSYRGACLRRGTTYYMTLRAHNSAPGYSGGPWKFRPVRLLMPANLRVSPGREGKATVRWSNRNATGEVNSYLVQYRTAGYTAPWSTKCDPNRPRDHYACTTDIEGITTTSVEITGLYEGVEYEVRVQARARATPWPAADSPWAGPAIFSAGFDGDDGNDGEEGGGGGGGGGGDEPPPPPSMWLSASPNPVDEGDAVTVTVSLSAAMETAVVAPVALTPVTAESGDYGELPPITIPAGQTSGTGRIPTTDDADRDDETFTAAIRSMPPGVNGGSPTSVTVTIRDTTPANEPPAFGEASYTFGLPENADGRRSPVALGTVAAEDLDGDAVTYSLASGDGERFAVGAPDGAVTYVGAGEDYESEPNRFELSVRARDTDGAEARARVVVEVTDVNEPPEADDDEAATAEDESVVVDVLANDTDPDGDGLRVASVSEPAHGTTAVAAGGILYAPPANYHGTDRFTYVAADAEGLADTATVEVTVTPVNDGPAAVGAIPDQLLEEGGDGVTVELAPFFSDIDGDPLTFRAATSDAEVATAAVAGAALVLAPAAHGDAVVTVTATDPGGLAATQRVTVGVSDRPGREVLSDALAAMGRSYLSSARMTLARRVASGARADAGQASALRVGGRPVALPDGHTLWEAAREALTGWLPDPGRTWGRFAQRGYARAAGTRAHGAQWPASGDVLSVSDLAPLDLANPMGRVRLPAGVSGSDFTLGWGGSPADSAGSGTAWALWGQSDVQRFDGGAAELASASGGIAGDYDGDLRGRWLGLDAQFPSWLLGVALGRSRGTGDWNAGTASGRLSTSMTSVHPYLRWSSGTTTVWTTLGAGWGEARNERTATGHVGTSPLDLAMGLVDFQRLLGPARGAFAFGLRADAGWADLSTGEGTETIDAVRGRVHQARLGLDARIGGPSFAPFGAVHMRHDGGDGRTGRGVELSGGLRARLGFLSLDAQGRWLAVHSVNGYAESGAGLTLTLGGRGDEGFSLSTSPRWGGQTAGGVALWQDRAPGMPPGHRAAVAGWTMDARGAYRARLGDRLLEVATVYDRTSGSHRLQLAGHVGLRAGDHR